jgi:hypothetical protein
MRGMDRAEEVTDVVVWVAIKRASFVSGGNLGICSLIGVCVRGCSFRG